MAVLLDWNLSKCPFLRQIVNLDLLLCAGFDSEHADLFLFPICFQRLMNNGKIKRSFLKQASHGHQLQLPTWKHPLLGLASPTSLSCSGDQPEELGHWLCSQNLQLLMIGARTWTQTWSMQSDWPVVQVLSAQKSLNKLCGVWIFVDLLKLLKLQS